MSAADLDPVRPDGPWRSAAVLERFGPAERDEDYLAKTITAQLILLGPERLEAVAAVLLRKMAPLLSRLAQLTQDPSLSARRAVLEQLSKACAQTRDELGVAQVRARNEVRGLATRERLRWVDLWALKDAVRRVILLEEVCKRENLAGLDFARGRLAQRPSQAEAERWSRWLLGPVHGLLLFTPQEYGRVVVVHPDGRLLYDAGAEAERAPGPPRRKRA